MDYNDYELTKEAMIEAYAPSTGHIPAKYQRVFRKEASILGGLGQGIKQTAANMAGKIKAGVTTNPAGKQILGEGADLADKARFYGSKALNVAGDNPAATAALGTAGLAGTGFAAGRLSKPNQ